MNASPFRFTVCICTRNRPDDLALALLSVRLSRVPVHQVIVSDDSTDLRTHKLVAKQFPEATYISGPRRGLSANRNRAIEAVTGTHVLFMDDDVLLSRDFFMQVDSELREAGRTSGEKMIVTGLENKNGAIIYPHDQSFLGFQRRSYREGMPIRTVVINSTVFPAKLFDEIRFDEQLIYGYEEVDFATRAVRAGYTITLNREAVNEHYPSEINRDYYKPHVNTSRLYATFKRYWFTERRYAKAICFLAAAYLHILAYCAKQEGAAGAVAAFRSIGGSMRYMVRYAAGGRARGLPDMKTRRNAGGG